LLGSTPFSTMQDWRRLDITVHFLIRAREVRMSSSLAVIALISIVFASPFPTCLVRPSRTTFNMSRTTERSSPLSRMTKAKKYKGERDALARLLQ
jgi:histone acetyltransferase (RNA polymerase elongator complex component)